MEVWIIALVVFACGVFPFAVFLIGLITWLITPDKDKKYGWGGGGDISMEPEPWYKYPMDSYMYPTQPPIDVHIHKEPQSSTFDDAVNLVGSTFNDIFGL